MVSLGAATKCLTFNKVNFKKQLVKFKFKCSHFFNYNTTTIRKKKEVETELTIHCIKHNKGKKCVAAKGAKVG